MDFTTGKCLLGLISIVYILTYLDHYPSLVNPYTVTECRENPVPNNRAPNSFIHFV